MKKILALLLVVFMILPMFGIMPVSAADAAVAGDAKSFADPVNAGSDKYYPTKTLQTVDFTKIKSDAELKDAGITYLDVDASDSYTLSYVDDGVYYCSSSDAGYVLSNVKLDSKTSYIVDFTIRVNPEAHIFEASAAFTDLTSINGTVGGVVDKAGAFKLRLKQSNDTVSSLDNGKYYSNAACTSEIGSKLGSNAQTAIYTNQSDVRVKMVFTGGTWKYAEFSVEGETYYIYYNNASTAHTGYFGFRGVGTTKVVIKNLTISECAKDATESATVVNDGNIYRVAAGTAIDHTVYNKNALLVEANGEYSYATGTVTAVAGKTYTFVEQNSDLFVSPVHAGSTKYYTKKVLQTVDFTTIKNDADFAAAGMTYLDAAANDGYDVSYNEDGLHFSSQTNMGYLLSNVKMDSSSSYIADFTLRVNPTAWIFTASAVFPDKTTINDTIKSSYDRNSFKIRLNPSNKLVLDGATYYSDPEYTTSIGSNPGAAAQEAAITNKKDVRVRMLITGGTWQYAEVIVDGATYYVKANSAKGSQTGYFGFATPSGELNLVFKNLTISECEANPSAHAFVKSGDRLYRVGASQTLNESTYTAYSKDALAIKADGECFTSVTTANGKTYTVMSLSDITVKSAGASARLKTDSGLRFASGVDKEDIALLKMLKDSGKIRSYSYGTIITIEKYASELNNNITHASLDALAEDKGINVSYVDVAASDWYTETADSYIFVGSIVSIKSENYNREYASVGYITLTMADGSKVTVYADYKPVNARSVSYVAACAYYDKSVSYNDAQTKILTGFIGDRKYYPLVVDGASEYTVVYDADDSKAKAFATEIVSALADAGVNVPLKADTESVSGKGLYIGATSHALSKASAAYYINGQIGCDASGNIAVTGNLNACVAAMLDKVYELSSGLTKTLLFGDDIAGFYTEEGFGNAPKYTGSGTVELKYSFELSNSYYVLVNNATVTDYENYLGTLAAAGYECYHSTQSSHSVKMTNNYGTGTTTSTSVTRFDTYTDGYNILTLSYIEYKDSGYKFDSAYPNANNGNVKYITIAIDCIENSALPERNTEIEDITTEQITTVNTASAHVLRLRDGRFLIFDGGHNANDATAIYNIVTSQNVREGKPVIAAWFLTHPHVDHVNGMLTFINSYSNKVDVEAFVHNLPAYEQYNGKNTAEGNAANQAQVAADMLMFSTQYYDTITKQYPNSDIIVAHAGQRFEYGNIDIDVLFTSENLYKEQMYDTNGSSVAYSITGDTGRMIILGDQVEPAGGVLNSIYGSTLKCDIVQVAHHGYNNGNPDMYKSMNADYAIWTSSKSSITGYSNASKRNFFDHTSVFANIIPDASKPAITITENMTKNDMVALNVDMSGYVSAGSSKYPW